MEKEEKIERGIRATEADFLLQWGIRKKLRCVKIKEERIQENSDGSVRRKITSRVDRRVVRSDKESPSVHPSRLCRNLDSAILRSSPTEIRKSQMPSPEKEDRFYLTRGSALDENSRVVAEGGDEKSFVWPKFFISLSSKEKEEDFMAMKGCKLPQRPKKRAKYIQRSIHLVSPGTWLADLSHERYEVREKKSFNSKKRPRGLKAMGSLESDSD